MGHVNQITEMCVVSGRRLNSKVIEKDAYTLLPFSTPLHTIVTLQVFVTNEPV